MERNRMELLPGVFFTFVRLKDAPQGCFRAALLRQLDREEAGMNALLPDVLLQGTQRDPGPEALAKALDALGHAKASPFVRKLGEVQAFGVSAVFDNDPAVFPALAETLAGVLLKPDTRIGQLKKEAVSAALAAWDAADAQDDPLAPLCGMMCGYEDYAVPARGERPDAGPNYYQKLSKHYRKVLSAAPLELYYAGAAAPRDVTQAILDAFGAMPRGELEFDLGTFIRMNAVEAEPRTEDRSGPQGAHRVSVGWRLGDGMEDPDLPVLEALACALGEKTGARVALDVHKGILTAQTDVDPDGAEAAVSALRAAAGALSAGELTQEALDAARAGRIAALRAIPDDPAALEAFWLEQDLLGLGLAPDEYAAFTQEAALEDVLSAAAALECDAILIE